MILKINSQIDKENNYDYKEILIENGEDNIFNIEYVKQENGYGIRPKGIKQFVSTNSETLLNDPIGIPNATQKLQELDINQLFSFTEEELELLKNTYSNVIYQNIPNYNYGKQKNVVIELEGKNITTNVYFVKMTKEQFNNIYIAILEQLKKDEVILSKISNFYNLMKDQEITDDEKQNIKTEWESKLENKIQDIKSKNIGQEERVIAIYENRGKTVRMEIQTDEYNMTLDRISDLSNAIIELNRKEKTKEENSQKIRLQKTVQEKEENYQLTIKQVKDEKEENVELKIENRSDETNNIENNIEIKIYNTNNEGIINVNEKITIVNEFKDMLRLDKENNIYINELNEEQVNNVIQIIQNNLSEQIIKIQEVINQNDIQSILVGLNLAEPKQEGIYEGEDTTEAERNRFNSQFEFCIGEEIGIEKINRLLEIAKNSLESIKITEYKEKKREEDPPQPKQYKLIIKKDSKNEDLANSLIKYIEESKDKKFSVRIEYNERTGLVENIFITAEE